VIALAHRTLKTGFATLKLIRGRRALGLKQSCLKDMLRGPPASPIKNQMDKLHSGTVPGWTPGNR
jgi:hypothetical protein